MSLPGAIDDVDDKEPKERHVRRSSSHHKNERPTYTASVWEHQQSSWQETHRFCAGLEVDLDGSEQQHASSAGPQPHVKVHLPSTSLRALLQLQECLQAPNALQLDIGGDGHEGGAFSELFASMLAPLHETLPGNALQEVQLVLNEHACVKDAASRSGTPGVADKKVEAVDIFLCSVNSLEAHRVPTLILGRLKHPDHVHRTHGDGLLRFVAIVVCGKEHTGGETRSLGQEVGRALATTFMNEEFTWKARNAASQQVINEALDHYLSTLTIVPTVHMGWTQVSAASGAGSDQLLADSLVKGMQRRISKIHQPDLVAEVEVSDPSPFDGEAMEAAEVVQPPSAAADKGDYFVEVDKFTIDGSGWKPERRLRLGLELDVASGEERPHLPRVSSKGLQCLSRLVSKESVAIDVPAGSADSAIDAVVNQLSSSGLPASAATEVVQALQERVSQGVRRMEAAKNLDAELCNPVKDDESCLVLTVLGSKVPAKSSIFAAFVRLKEPLAGSFASGPPVRFLSVLVGPSTSSEQLALVGDSLAALAVDEDLMLNLTGATNVSSFVSAFENRLNDLVLLPHAHLHSTYGKEDDELLVSKSMPTEKKGWVEGEDKHPSPADSQKDKDINEVLRNASIGFDHMNHMNHVHSHEAHGPCGRALHSFVRVSQKYALPLVIGVLLAMIWVNIDEHSYDEVSHGAWFTEKIFDHPVSLHFFVNDIFMCFFFGLAIKEVTEAVLPGGSLNSLRRATSPLMGTVGGVAGPVVAYLVMVYILEAAGAFDGYQCKVLATGDGHRRLAGGGGGEVEMVERPCEMGDYLKGWGVPTATDISLAWMFALLIFGAGHSAVNYLLLLAIADDALGLAIIAIFYPDPAHPVEPQWLGLVVASAVVAFGIRWLGCQYWSPYVFIAGPISWLGLIKARVHPALALTVVVPFMPATLPKSESSRHRLSFARRKIEEIAEMVDRATGDHVHHASHHLWALEGAPLHAFEHHTKLIVDFGMFFFGFANAGVKLSAVGGITYSVIFALIVGKTIGIAVCAELANCCGFTSGLSRVDMFAMSALGGVGLTVALFVSNNAFVDPELQGQSKMGAVVSVLGAGVAWLIKSVGDKCFPPEEDDSGDGVEDIEASEEGDPEAQDEVDDWLDDLAMDDIMQVLWTQRKYQARGVNVSVEKVARGISKGSARPPSNSTTPRSSIRRSGTAPLKGAWGGTPEGGKSGKHLEIPGQEFAVLSRQVSPRTDDPLKVTSEPRDLEAEIKDIE